MSEPTKEAVQRLLYLARRYGLAELEWEADGLKVVVRTEESPAGPSAVAPPDAPPDYSEREDVHLLTAPLTGTFYRAAGPEAPPFVEVGQTIVAGDTIGILEAMKVFNEVPAEVGGVVLEIPAENGALVQEGDPLLVVEIAAE